MEKKFADQIWELPNSTENALELRGGGGGERDEEDEDEEEEEALSLSDLPLIQKEKEKEKKEERENQSQEQDFDFCSFSKESEMCVADEVFFQGQILPLGRHSLSSDKGSLHYLPRSISRSGSMDHYYSGRLISSRSSSISSHQSSTSGSSSATTTTSAGKFNHRPPRNRFHYSHPSPSPKLHSSIYKQGITTSNHRNSVNKSSIWNILKLGLVTTPPEIGFQDLKTRCLTNNNSTNCRNFGSRNSTSSNSSSVTSSKKKKARDLLGGCKCSADAVDTVNRRAVMIKRSASEGDVELRQEIKPTKKQAAKKQLSHHRTFEWLKQLSVEGAAHDEA